MEPISFFLKYFSQNILYIIMWKIKLKIFKNLKLTFIFFHIQNTFNCQKCIIFTTSAFFLKRFSFLLSIIISSIHIFHTNLLQNSLLSFPRNLFSKSLIFNIIITITITIIVTITITISIIITISIKRAAFCPR
jgi:hypothetical protein